MEGPGSFMPSVALMLLATFTAVTISATATAAATGAAVAIAILTAGAAASLATQLPAVAACPLRLSVALGALAAAPPSFEAARVRRLELQSGYTSNEHSVEDTFPTRPALQVSSRRSSAPARLESTETVQLGDSVSTDSYSQLSSSSSGSERTLDSATVSSSDGKSPFAEAGSWTEAWESWLHPAAILSLNATSPRGRQSLAAAAASRGFPVQSERRQQEEDAGSVKADGDEESVTKAHQPPRHCLGCLGRNSSSALKEFVPFFDKAIVLPRQLKQDLLFIITMDTGSVLLITSDGLVCHEASPTDLDVHVYAANAALDNCDFERLLTWKQVYPLIPPSYVLWRFSGHYYFFRKPNAEFVEKHAGIAFCFTLEDVETHKVATFIIATNGADKGGYRWSFALSVVLTVIAGVLPSCF